MEILQAGHIYALRHLEGEGKEVLTFIKRSGGAIDYGKSEHPGTNTQEVLRALIDRSKYLDSILPCDETQDAILYLRLALYSYEVRAYRRKLEDKNKKKHCHNDSTYPNVWRDGQDDIPFTEFEIELLPVNSDGHIRVE